MEKSKYDFIKELLENKNIHQSHRERILELTSKEISLDGTIDERLRKIEEIIYEDKIGTSFEKFGVSQSEIKTNNLPKYFPPYYLYKFLLEYNQNPILRTTCHEVDTNELLSILEFCNKESYNLDDHLKLIISEYQKHEDTYKAPPQSKALIRGYLSGKNYYGNATEWGSNKIKINWSSTEISKWATENPQTPPNSSTSLLREKKIKKFEINPNIKSPLTEKPIQSFNQLVLHFKNLLHVKSGPQSLYEIIKRVNDEKKWSEKVEFKININEFSNNLEHFLDLEKFIQAYNKFIELTIEQNKPNQKPIVELKYFGNNKRVIFSINHLNGVYNKTIENTIERLGQTYTSLINNQLNGLCNLILKADFGNQKYAEVNLWDGKNRTFSKLSTFQGVEHQLIFLKEQPQ